MTTALDIITKAMQKAGVTTKNEAPASDEANDALDALNDMWASWSNDTLMLVRARETFNLVANQRDYTIGAGGDFNTVRPLFITNATVRQDTIDYTLIKIDDTADENISFKPISGIPEYFNYTNSYPLGNIRIWPAPSTAYEIRLLSEKPINAVSLHQTLSLPEGWNRASIYNLAMEIAPEYGQQVDPSVAMIASQSLGAIKKNNARNRAIDIPRNTGGGFNIYRGW